MVLLALLSLPLGGIAGSPVNAKLEQLVLDAKASSIRYHGVASLHSFDADAKSIAGEAAAPASAPQNGFSEVRGKIVIDVNAIDTGVNARNDEMFKLLELPKHPTMTFALATAESLPNRTEDGREIDTLNDGEVKCALKGTLTVKGVAAPIEGRGKCSHTTSGAWRIEGEAPVDMQKHGIKPPHVAFIGMDPVVRVKYKLVFNRK